MNHVTHRLRSTEAVTRLQAHHLPYFKILVIHLCTFSQTCTLEIPPMDNWGAMGIEVTHHCIEMHARLYSYKLTAMLRNNRISGGWVYPHLQSCPELLLFSFDSRPTDGPGNRLLTPQNHTPSISVKSNSLFWQGLPNRLGAWKH